MAFHRMLKFPEDISRISASFRAFLSQSFRAICEIGVNIYPWPNSIGFHLAGFYNYSTNKGTVFNYDMDKLQNFGFRVGVAF